ncbi:MAG: methylenetetrahydrofolate reductase C-terminal domain-containing protein [Candidatus Omnitrophica bacterium]|nr:methylenetetrahydrofolate reductase C-terminal domain-containing protein [Candidatus Omnitrophota bacterium]
MIISEAKPFQEVLDSVQGFTRIFLVGCGDCATLCKSGGEGELLAMKEKLEAQGKAVPGFCIPESTCAAAKLKTELAKNMKAVREAEAILVLACGLGVQSVKDNDRFGLAVLPANNTVFGACMDGQGNFLEKCSLCGECILAKTGGICPVTLCPKGILNGPCGGMDKGKCELDKERDCAWVLIWRELEKNNKLESFRINQPPRDHKKALKPHRLAAAQK